MKLFKNSLKEKVRGLLEDCIKYRDSDLLLIARIWHEQTTKSGEFTALEMEVVTRFLKLVRDKSLPNPESIRRIRCKLQEEFTFLRGNLYTLRKGELEAQAKDELGYNSVHVDDHNQVRINNV